MLCACAVNRLIANQRAAEDKMSSVQMIASPEDLQNKAFASAAMPQWQTLFCMLGLSLIVYLPAALGSELLMFDDAFYFGPDNAEFVEGLAAVATKPIANAYLPLAHISLWFDYKLGEGSSFLPHLNALLLHGLAGVALARLLLQLGLSRFSAHLVAAIFIVHPSLCESVAWVSSRKYVLSGLFTFLALNQTVRFAQVQSLSRAAVIATLAAAAMFSNATAVVLPFLSVGVVLWCQGPRARWIAPLVLFAVTVPIALFHTSVAAAQGTMVTGDVMSRLQQVPGAFWHYLTTALWPTRLNILYPEIDTLEAFRVQWLPGLLAIAGFVAAGIVFSLWRVTRPIAAGLLTFVVALLPFNTAFPASSIAAADRYLYLAIPGLALAVVALTAVWGRRGPWLAAVLLVPLIWLSGSRAHDFADDATLWQSSLDVDEVNAVAHYNRAIAAWNVAALREQSVEIEAYEGHLQAAITSARYPIHELRARRKLLPLQMARADYKAAAANVMAAVAAAKDQLAQESAAPRIAIASADLLQIQIDAFEPLQLSGNEFAADEMLAAVKDQAPQSPDVIAFQAMRDLAALRPELLQLAAAGKAPRLAADDPRAAAVDATLQAALNIHENHHGLWLAQALWNQAREFKTTAALRCFKKATDLRKDSVIAWLSAARMLREKSMYESALEYAQNGLKYRHDPRLLQEIALSLVGLNRLDQAEKWLSDYMVLKPDDADSGKILANLLIGRAYQMLSDHTKRDEVRKLVADALRYNKDESKAHLVLGRLAHEEKKFSTAVGHLEVAFELMPNFEDARKQLSKSLAALGFASFMNRQEARATDAWIRCLEVAPKDFDGLETVRQQLQLAWVRLERRGLARSKAGDVVGAIEDFRRCLTIDPDQHWAAWLLATSIYKQAEVDLAELETLCRKALGWQQKHDQDTLQQSYLLAVTLQRRGEEDSARQVAKEYLQNPSDTADPQILAVLQALAGS